MEKPANQRCQHQKHGVGCSIYESRPQSCRLWSCQWLTNPDTNAMRRPDRSHYCIDPVPDFIRLINNEDGTETKIPVLQIWCDPDFPNSHRDPALRAFLERLAEKTGMAALIRFSNKEAIVLLAPPLTGGEWLESGGTSEKEHNAAQINAALTDFYAAEQA